MGTMRGRRCEQHIHDVYDLLVLNAFGSSKDVAHSTHHISIVLANAGG